ncbi:hypothetical protein GQ42DRAFT_46355 [Ramicandelaber brevisporus]|nr:hypothetical protein GQ42DRAFT_46355 [Ramicandelaber brevisporus]
MKRRVKRARLDPAVVAAACQLFRLPRELLEMVAAYFSRREAVPVLAVNSTLHEIFAERIWRRLDTYKRSIPQASLLKYGHLVRRIKATESIPQSISLAAVLPNVTHLWLSFFDLLSAVKSSRGKCFNRLCCLGIESFNYKFDKNKLSKTVDSVLNWIDNRLEAEGGLEKVEWELSTPNDMKWLTRLLPWFRSHCVNDKICFKLSGDEVNLDDIKDADTRALVSSHLIDWNEALMRNWYETPRLKCPAATFSGILDSIPLAERQHFQFPALKQLRIGTCCNVGGEVYSQFNFEKLFPSVRDLIFDSNSWNCYNTPDEGFGSILAHPWPSVRKLEISGNFIYEESIFYLTALSNVEELSMYWNTRDGEHDDLCTVNLHELGRALPNLERLKIEGFEVTSSFLQPQKIVLWHLSYVHFKNLTMKVSAIDTLVHAPALTDICLECVNFEKEAEFTYGDESDSDSDSVYGYSDDCTFDFDDADDYMIKNKKRFYSGLDEDYRLDGSPIKLGFLNGVTNVAVRFIDIRISEDFSPDNYEDIIKAILRCFNNLRLCIIRTYQRNALPDILKGFSNDKFKRI